MADVTKKISFEVDLQAAMDGLKSFLQFVSQQQTFLQITPQFDGKSPEVWFKDMQDKSSKVIYGARGEILSTLPPNVKPSPGSWPQTNAGGQTGNGQDPTFGNNAYGALRNDPNFQYMEMQKAIAERQRSMGMATGGKSAGDFLESKIQAATGKLGGGNDPQLTALIAALNGLKTTVADLESEMETSKAAMYSTDPKMAALGATAHESQLRAMQASVESAGGGGGGGNLSWMDRAAKGFLYGKYTEMAFNTAGDVLNGPAMALKQKGDVGAAAGSMWQSALRMSSSDLLGPLDPNAQGTAAYVSKFGVAGAVTGYMGGVFKGASTGAAEGGLGAALMGGVAAGAGPISGSFFGGSARDAMRANSAMNAFGEIGRSNSALSTTMDEAYGMLGDVRGYADAFGVGEHSKTLGNILNNSRTGTEMSRFTQAETLGGMNARSRLGEARATAGAGGVNYLARALGMTPSAAGAAAYSLEGANANGLSSMNSIAQTGAGMGLSGGSIQDAFGSIGRMANEAGGTGGAVESGMFQKGLASAGAFLGSGNGQYASAMSEQTMGDMRSESNKGGGLQGAMNMIAASATVDQLYPGIDKGTRARLINILRQHDPNEFRSRSVMEKLNAEAARGGFAGGAPSAKTLIGMMTSRREGLNRGMLKSVYGSTDDFINRAQSMSGAEHTLGDIAGQSFERGDFIGGVDRTNHLAGTDEMIRRRSENENRSDVKLNSARDDMHFIAAARGMELVQQKAKEMSAPGAGLAALVKALDVLDGKFKTSAKKILSLQPDPNSVPSSRQEHHDGQGKFY